MTRTLRVVHVNNGDVGHGGAALAAYRLHHALRESGVESRMRVAMKASDDDTVLPLPQRPRFQRYAGAVMRRVGLNDLVGIDAYRIGRLPDVAEADVVHFHLLEGNWFSYPALATITDRVPGVITLHDMWPATGHCSYSYECDRWSRGCGDCPHLDVFPEVSRDATAVEWRFKDATYRRSRLEVIAPCEWMATIARGGMLGRFPVHVVPYALDTDSYSPRDRVSSRAALGLGPSEPVIAVSAASFADHRKGADLLVEALRSMPGDVRAGLVLLVMGWRGNELAPAIESLGVRPVILDYLWSDTLKALVYSAADVFVLPTRADNSPLVLLESMACGTPAVSFAVGGVPETVVDGETGLLAPPEDAGALGDAMARLLTDVGLRGRLAADGRDLVVDRHRAQLVADRHRRIYEAVAADAEQRS